MIFDELVIHNFGIYKGRHQILLSPQSPKRPIVLFGGLNGGGKTTFLDALQLTLYGKFANCSNRGNLAYQEFLKETINRYASPKDGAMLELKFSIYIDGELHTYHVKRFWRVTDKSNVREEMEVIHNGVVDPVMAEQWYEYVNEFIPLSISGLFFFDGEKIEALADPSGSAKLIQTGVLSLLGLDIVEKLGSDLDALMRADMKSLKNDSEDIISPELQNQENKIVELVSRKEGFQQNLASVASRIDNLNREMESLEKSYRAAGGELFDARNSFHSSLETLNSEIKEKEKQLQLIAGSAFPLSLVADLLWQTKEQVLKESEGDRVKILLSEIEKRNKNLISFLSKQHADRKTLDLVKNKLNEDINGLKKSIPLNRYLGLSTDAFRGLDQDMFNELKMSVNSICRDLSELKEKQIHAERKISSIPEEETLANVQRQIWECKNSLIQEQAKCDILKEQLIITQRQLEQAESKLVSTKLAINKTSIELELKNRTYNNVQDVKSILGKFQLLMLEKHIKHLEVLILESFLMLIRKANLVAKVVIDPATYQIQLLNSSLEHIPSSRLSAGERQILAISILWGLAKASGRPLPMIIDTPLGRLDSMHRKNLVDNYFPVASHQVILLSTDQEIDKHCRDDLSKYIGREYHIQYEEKLQTSTIREGYF